VFSAARVIILMTRADHPARRCCGQFRHHRFGVVMTIVDGMGLIHHLRLALNIFVIPNVAPDLPRAK